MPRRILALTAAGALALAAPAGVAAAPQRHAVVDASRRPHLALKRTERFAGHEYTLTGHRLVIRARFGPRHTPGERALARVRMRGHLLVDRTPRVRRVGHHGVVELHFRVRDPGWLHIRVDSARATVRAVEETARPGDDGAGVSLLQHMLAAEHYAVSHSGTLDPATGRALIAFRKVNGMPLTPAAGPTIFSMLARGKGAFQARYPTHGRHVEADLSRRVLALVDPHGKIYRVYTTSPGKPSTPTIQGHFHFYRKDPGYNSERMYFSSYFIRGYAVHGYYDVPYGYSASHGCLRIPMSNAVSVYDWISVGMPIDVYP